MPEGIRCSFHSSSPRTIVCPALLPPWNLATASACSASRSVILPLPSSPHWAPTITIPGMPTQVYGGPPARPGASSGGEPARQPRRPELAALVLAIERDQVAADLDEP